MTTGPGAIALDGRGVNESGFESGNALAVAGNTLAWLQDVPAEDAWGLWTAVLRDCVVLDALGRAHGVMNLTANSLLDPVHYEALRTLILQAHAAVP
jgi:hypothetical protein